MQLPSDRAFVLHLDARARPPQFTVGRVEHVVSGRVGHFASLDELIAFLAGVLAARCRRGNGDAMAGGDDNDATGRANFSCRSRPRTRAGRVT